MIDRMIARACRHLATQRQTARTDALFRNGQRVRLLGDGVQHLPSLALYARSRADGLSLSPSGKACVARRTDVVFSPGDEVRVLGKEITHVRTGRTVSLLDGEGKGQVLNLPKQFDESPGAVVTNKQPIAFSFRNVSSQGTGEIVTLQGLSEEPGELIDLKLQSVEGADGAFYNVVAFGTGEDVVLHDLKEVPGEVIDMSTQGHPPKMAKTTNITSGLLQAGDEILLRDRQVVHMSTGRVVERVDGLMHRGDRLRLVGNEVVHLKHGVVVARCDVLFKNGAEVSVSASSVSTGAKVAMRTDVQGKAAGVAEQMRGALVDRKAEPSIHSESAHHSNYKPQHLLADDSELWAGKGPTNHWIIFDFQQLCYVTSISVGLHHNNPDMAPKSVVLFAGAEPDALLEVHRLAWRRSKRKAARSRCKCLTFPLDRWRATSNCLRRTTTAMTLSY